MKDFSVKQFFLSIFLSENSSLFQGRANAPFSKELITAEC